MRKMLLLLFPIVLISDVLSKKDCKYALKTFGVFCNDYLYKEIDSTAKVCGYIDFYWGGINIFMMIK